MKKIMKIITQITLVILLCICVGCALKKTEKTEKNEKPKESIQKETIPYTDNNPIVGGLYTRSSGVRTLREEYSHTWVLNEDIGVFSFFATQDPTIAGDAIQNMWSKYWNNYDNIENYKIGYSLEFTNKSGETIYKTILKPADTESFYDYLQVYLYDDIHQDKGAWYSHVEGMKEDTLLTSIKITGSTLTHEIASSIQLAVFTYKSSDEFDEKGKYRGKSSFVTKIQRI